MFGVEVAEQAEVSLRLLSNHLIDMTAMSFDLNRKFKPSELIVAERGGEEYATVPPKMSCVDV